MKLITNMNLFALLLSVFSVFTAFTAFSNFGERVEAFILKNTSIFSLTSQWGGRGYGFYRK